MTFYNYITAYKGKMLLFAFLIFTNLLDKEMCWLISSLLSKVYVDP